MDKTFHALAHHIRRDILDLLKEQPGMSVNKIAEPFNVSRVAIMKHLKILEEANLLSTEKVGKQRLHYFNVIPIQQIYERWTDDYSRFMASRLTAFKQQLEQEESDDEREDQQKCS